MRQEPFESLHKNVAQPPSVGRTRPEPGLWIRQDPGTAHPRNLPPASMWATESTL